MKIAGVKLFELRIDKIISRDETSELQDNQENLVDIYEETKQLYAEYLEAIKAYNENPKIDEKRWNKSLKDSLEGQIIRKHRDEFIPEYNKFYTNLPIELKGITPN